jgi:hypothetical protein
MSRLLARFAPVLPVVAPVQAGAHLLPIASGGGVGSWAPASAGAKGWGNGLTHRGALISAPLFPSSSLRRQGAISCRSHRTEAFGDGLLPSQERRSRGGAMVWKRAAIEGGATA